MKSRRNHIQKKLFPSSKQKNIDPRNKLNDLDGKEWIKFLKSWFVFDALKSDLAEEKAITKDTKDHPATFSPTMIADFIKFFTKRNMKVLDPFVGIGTTLVACDRTGRKGIGVEINPKYLKIAQKRITKKQIIDWSDALYLTTTHTFKEGISIYFFLYL